MTRRCNDVTNTRAKQLKPNVKSFTAVLNACARPADDLEKDYAFSIAQLTMAELSLGRYGEPNFLSFAAFLSVCATTLDPGQKRDFIVRKTFEDCIKAGQVGHIVLEKLYSAASSDLFDELVRDIRDEKGKFHIPKHWNKKITGERTVGSSSIQTAYTGSETNTNNISNSSKQRFKAVRQFGGKSGVYSSSHRNGMLTIEDEEIVWSTGDFSKANRENIQLEST
jgi:hypothetical protein